MDQLAENISSAAQTLQHITRDARQRQEERGDASPALVSSLQMMHQKAWVDAHWPIAWHNRPPGLWAKGVALYHKLTRRMLRWYINPIVQQQNEFNRATLDVIHILAQQVRDLRSERSQDCAERQAQLDAMTARIETLQRALQEGTG